jgi:hypothetical protein
MTRSARSGTDGGMSTPMACVAGRFSSSSKLRDRRGMGFAEAGVGRREMQIASTRLRRRFIASTPSHAAASRRGTAAAGPQCHFLVVTVAKPSMLRRHGP